MKKGSVRLFFRGLGDIFMPLLPGFIVAGVCAGLASLLQQFVPDYEKSSFFHVLYTLLSTVNNSFTPFLTAWVGYYAARKFGATPIMGGMLGMVTSLDGINVISEIIGLTKQVGLETAILQSGSGGVLAVILGVLFLSRIEAYVHKRMPSVIDSVFTPLISFFICLVPYIFILMPILGLVSNLLCLGLQMLIFNENILVRLLAGYICAALFLPANVLGVQFAFVAIYSLQLNIYGDVSLYPVLAMAGAGQVGAGIAVFLKAGKVGNKTLKSAAASGILPGIMGIGSPLLYGVSVPYTKTLLTTCLGAGFGGAFIVLTKVSCTGWGPSGILALPLMTAGAAGPLMSMFCYFIGLCISCLGGFILTMLMVPANSLENNNQVA